MTDACGGYGHGFGGQHIIENRQIMNCQVPKDIHIMLEQPQIDAHRIVVVNLTQHACRYQFLDLSHGACVNECVIHHQHPLAASSLFDQLNRLLRACCEGLFNQHVFIGLEGLKSQCKM